MSGTGCRSHAAAIEHHVFHKASRGFLDDCAYMSSSRRAMRVFSQSVTVMSRARLMLPLPPGWITGKSGRLVMGVWSKSSMISCPWMPSQRRLMLVMETPCSFMVSMLMFRRVFMSSTPVRATSMAMSPMWLSCNHWSISPNPMAAHDS